MLFFLTNINNVKIVGYDTNDVNFDICFVTVLREELYITSILYSLILKFVLKLETNILQSVQSWLKSRTN